MTDDIWYADEGGKFGRLVPLYVLVNGRTTPSNTSLDLATQVIATSIATVALEPEYQEIIHRCSDWMSVAEIAAYVDRPLTVTKVLIDVLLERGLLTVGSPAEKMIADRLLLETLLDGLQKL